MTCNNELCREAVDALREFLDAESDWDKHPTGEKTRRCIAARMAARAVLSKIDAASDEEDA